MTGWNLPPGCTDADIDRAARGDEDERDDVLEEEKRLNNLSTGSLIEHLFPSERFTYAEQVRYEELLDEYIDKRIEKYLEPYELHYKRGDW